MAGDVKSRLLARIGRASGSDTARPLELTPPPRYGNASRGAKS